MANAKHLASAPGLLQIVTLVFGAIAVGCGAPSFESQFFKERFFFWAVVATMIFSALFLIINIISGHQVIRAMSSALHVVGGILLLIAGSLMIVSVHYIKNELCTPRPWGGDCNFNKAKKLAAASFAIINGIVFLILAVIHIMVKSEDDEGYLETGDTRKFGRPQK